LEVARCGRFLVVFVFALLLDMLAVGSRETERYPRFNLIKSYYKSLRERWIKQYQIPRYK